MNKIKNEIKFFISFQHEDSNGLSLRNGKVLSPVNNNTEKQHHYPGSNGVNRNHTESSTSGMSTLSKVQRDRQIREETTQRREVSS